MSSKLKNPDSLLFWIDLEMTGLDPQKDMILEIASLMTTKDLEVVAEGPDLVIHHGLSTLEGMDEWNTEHHQASGLWKSVLESTVSLAEAEKQTLDFAKIHCKPSESPICGNTVWQDRRFMYRYMPELEAHFHYRVIDTSTIKELYQRWKPEARLFEKKEAHRALGDIRESIEELKFFKQQGFIG